MAQELLQRTHNKVDASSLVEMGIINLLARATVEIGDTPQHLNKLKRVGGVFVEAAFRGEKPKMAKKATDWLLVPPTPFNKPEPTAPNIIVPAHGLVVEFKRTLRHPDLLPRKSEASSRFVLREQNDAGYAIVLSRVDASVVQPLTPEMSEEASRLIEQSMTSGINTQHFIGKQGAQPTSSLPRSV